MTFKIEKGVPNPRLLVDNTNVPDALRALVAADSGDSLFFPGGKIGSIRANVQRLFPGGKKMSTRQVEGGVRVWKL